MKLAIMQPYIYPYLGYFQLIAAVDKFVVYDDVNYINRGWINRNNLLVNGQPYLFSIPLKKASQNRLIREIELAEDASWKAKFMKTVESSYKKAPYFEPVYTLIKDVIVSDAGYIHELVFQSLRSVAGYLQLPTVFVETSTIYDNQELKGQQRILDICKKEKASHYINPIGGLEIYDRELFNTAQIHFNFLKTSAHSYKQFNDEFVPYLSIIDVLMFNSTDEIKKLLTQYDLV